jgi:hypothetical protein
MTKPIPADTFQIAQGSISEHLGNCISEAQKWIGPADQGAVCLSMKLAKCIDVIFDSGTDLDKAAALIGRLTVLMKELKLTPLARDASKAMAEEVDHGTAYAETYLRLVNSPNSKPKATRAKSGTSSRSTSK